MSQIPSLPTRLELPTSEHHHACRGCAYIYEPACSTYSPAYQLFSASSSTSTPHLSTNAAAMDKVKDMINKVGNKGSSNPQAAGDASKEDYGDKGTNHFPRRRCPRSPRLRRNGQLTQPAHRSRLRGEEVRIERGRLTPTPCAAGVHGFADSVASQSRENNEKVTVSVLLVLGTPSAGADLVDRTLRATNSRRIPARRSLVRRLAHMLQLSHRSTLTHVNREVLQLGWGLGVHLSMTTT